MVSNMTKRFTVGLLAFSFASGAVFASWTAKPETGRYAPPPKSIVICGIKDHPCVTYAVSFHPPAETYGDGPGEGVTDYAAKTIAIASSSDHFKNVQALEHEVYHAALWERGFQETETWDLHAWIYFSEGPFTMVLHDNPDFLHYIQAGY
jgi:hypothetical protein